ncbi:hypothetical protein ABW19_dt0209246 [Dactylella cylindrospora]|nr:hypothetical protein ABW19_dt0209246 [Dactylella cylindrospora]
MASRDITADLTSTILDHVPREVDKNQQFKRLQQDYITRSEPSGLDTSTMVFQRLGDVLSEHFEVPKVDFLKCVVEAICEELETLNPGPKCTRDNGKTRRGVDPNQEIDNQSDERHRSSVRVSSSATRQATPCANRDTVEPINTRLRGVLNTPRFRRTDAKVAWESAAISKSELISSTSRDSSGDKTVFRASGAEVSFDDTRKTVEPTYNLYFRGEFRKSVEPRSQDYPKVENSYEKLRRCSSSVEGSVEAETINMVNPREPPDLNGGPREGKHVRAFKLELNGNPVSGRKACDTGSGTNLQSEDGHKRNSFEDLSTNQGYPLVRQEEGRPENERESEPLVGGTREKLEVFSEPGQVPPYYRRMGAIQEEFTSIPPCLKPRYPKRRDNIALNLREQQNQNPGSASTSTNLYQISENKPSQLMHQAEIDLVSVRPTSHRDTQATPSVRSEVLTAYAMGNGQQLYSYKGLTINDSDASSSFML